MARKNLDIDPKTGLPADLGIWEALQQDEEEIRISLDKRKWGKPMTVVTFSRSKGSELKQLSKKAKSYCASGGTYKENRIEIQGEHRKKMKKFLIKEGYDEQNIDII